MIDNNKFQDLLKVYKNELKGNRWNDEKFKWHGTMSRKRTPKIDKF